MPRSVPAHGMGVSVPSKPDHDQVPATGVHVGDGGGGVPGLDGRDHLILPADVEVCRVPVPVRCDQGTRVGNRSMTSDGARFSTLYRPFPGCPMPDVSKLSLILSITGFSASGSGSAEPSRLKDGFDVGDFLVSVLLLPE